MLVDENVVANVLFDDTDAVFKNLLIVHIFCEMKMLIILVFVKYRWH